MLQSVEPAGGFLPHARAYRYVYREGTSAGATRVMALAVAGDTFNSAHAIITDIIAIGNWK
ncbi:MAG: hypothetical protein WDA03_08355 [Trueperaceae bacterium]